MKRKWLFLFFVLCFLLTTQVLVVWAADPVTVTFDFEAGMPPEFSFTDAPSACTSNHVVGPMVRATGDGHGYGLHEADADPSKGDTGQSMIVFPHLVNTTGGSVHVYSTTTGTVGAGVYLCSATGTLIASTFQYPASSTISIGTYSNVAAIVLVSLECEANSPTACENMIAEGMGGYHVWLDDISISYEDTGVSFNHNLYGQTNAGPYRPVSTIDTTSISTDHKTVTTSQGAKVHLIQDGTLGQITHVTFNENTWTVLVRAPGATTDEGAITYSHLTQVNGITGDAVTAGCVIGLAADGTASGSTPVGQVNLLGPGGILTDWPTYDDAPDNTPCDASKYTTTNCKDLNPNFADDGKNWDFNGNVIAEEGQLRLAGGSYISQEIPLDNTQAYHVTLFASLDSILDERNADVGITVGSMQSTMHLSETVSGEWVELTSQDLDIGEPGPNGQYQFAIHAPVAHGAQLVPNLLLRFACISTTPVEESPGDCYFKDRIVSDTNWERDETVGIAEAPVFDIGSQITGRTRGMYSLPNDTKIWHDVDISAFNGADANYQLTIGAKPIYSIASPAPLVPPYGRIHAYIRDSVSHDIITDIGTADIPVAFVLAPIKLPFTLASTEHVAGQLVVENISGEINDDSGWSLAVEIPCLSVEGGEWPGYGLTADTPALNQGCLATAEPVAALTDSSILSVAQWLAAWLQYGFQLVRNLVLCTLFNLFMNIYAVAKNITEWMAMQALWLSLEAISLAKGLLMLYLSLITWWLNTPLAKWLYDHVVDALIFANYLADFLSKLGHFLLILWRLPAFITELIFAFIGYLRDAVNAVPESSVTFVCTTNTATTGLCGGLSLMDRMFANVPIIDVLFYIMFGLMLITNFIWTGKKLTELLDMFSQAVQK